MLYLISSGNLRVRQHLRHDHIIEKVMAEGFVTIDDLVTSLNVTPQTIRRDLNLLADQNRISRYHGGAGLLESSTENTAYTNRLKHGSKAKQLIAKRLVDDIPDGASIFINIGTTTEAVARELLRRKNLSIITNNLHVAATLSEREDYRIILAGGEVRARDGGIIGEATVDLIRQFQADFAIIGVSGIDENGTLLDFDYREVRVSQAIIENARQVMLCADKSKFGRNAMVRLGTIAQIDSIYTDVKPSDEFVTLLNDNGVKLNLP